MARVPGTESHSNRSGFTPGEAVRCRRSRANDERGLMDRRGFLTEVRTNRVCVLLDTKGHSIWLESDDVLSEPLPEGAPLETLRRAYTRLAGHRIEFDDEEGITVFSAGFPAEHLDDVRRMLGSRLAGLEVAAFGVHELAVHLRFPD